MTEQFSIIVVVDLPILLAIIGFLEDSIIEFTYCFIQDVLPNLSWYYFQVQFGSCTEWIGEVCIWFVETIPNVPDGNAVPLMISVCCFSLLFKLMFNLIVIIVIALSNARPTSFPCGLVKLELVSVEKFKN